MSHVLFGTNEVGSRMTNSGAMTHSDMSQDDKRCLHLRCAEPFERLGVRNGSEGVTGPTPGHRCFHDIKDKKHMLGSHRG